MKKALKKIAIVTGLATALAPQVAPAQNNTVIERQAVNDMKPTKKHSITNHIGGLPLVTEYYGNPPGLTPKQYGILYGNGKSRKQKINKKHRSHLAKLKSKY